jgi:hypothetical protein
MDDDIVDLGLGALFIGGLDPVDLSNLAVLIAQAEQSDVETIELDTTK